MQSAPFTFSFTVPSSFSNSVPQTDSFDYQPRQDGTNDYGRSCDETRPTEPTDASFEFMKYLNLLSSLGYFNTGEADAQSQGDSSSLEAPSPSDSLHDFPSPADEATSNGKGKGRAPGARPAEDKISTHTTPTSEQNGLSQGAPCRSSSCQLGTPCSAPFPPPIPPVARRFHDSIVRQPPLSYHRQLLHRQQALFLPRDNNFPQTGPIHLMYGMSLNQYQGMLKVTRQVLRLSGWDAIQKNSANGTFDRRSPFCLFVLNGELVLYFWQTKRCRRLTLDNFKSLWLERVWPYATDAERAEVDGLTVAESLSMVSRKRKWRSDGLCVREDSEVMPIQGPVQLEREFAFDSSHSQASSGGESLSTQAGPLTAVCWMAPQIPEPLQPKFGCRWDNCRHEITYEQSAIKDHLVQYHGISNPGAWNQRCLWTGGKCSTRAIANIGQHISKVHMEENALACEICRKKYVVASALRRHIRSEHSGENEVRVVSGEQFVMEDGLFPPAKRRRED